MRFHFFVLALIFAGPAAADPPNAQEALVERVGLLEIDSRCRLLAAGARNALEASAGQARGALLRAGWTRARLTQLESAVSRAARERTCTDAQTRAAVADAREAYDVWATLSMMEFPGWRRTWLARRAIGPNGWRLSQAMDANTVFGVRQRATGETLSLIINGSAPISARIEMRDVARSAPAALDLPTRIAYGLEAGAPQTGAPRRVFAATRSTERRVGVGGQQTVFTFPNEAFRVMLALDPRETIEIHVTTGRVVQRLYVEVGDVASARAFLAARAD